MARISEKSDLDGFIEDAGDASLPTIMTEIWGHVILLVIS
jgi:hypothetical protein